MINGKSGVSTFAEAVSTHYRNSFNEYEARRAGSQYVKHFWSIESEKFWTNVRAYRISLNKLIEFITTEPQNQGYLLTDFLHTWWDTLDMEKELYGKITDKYPANLASLHQKLSYDMVMLLYARKIEQDAEKNRLAMERRKELKKYDYQNTTDKYFITSPESVADILDEKQQQQNCLDRYVDRYVEGETDLFFMRDKSHPDLSLVTIEVNNHVLRQAFLKFNSHPNNEQMDFIGKWCDKYGIERSERFISHP